MKKGNLLIPISEDAKKIWGKGIVTEPYKLQWPDAHLVYWFGHNREIVIEQEIIENNFEIVQAQEQDK